MTLSNRLYYRLLHLDSKFADKFNIGTLHFWPYCRQYLLKKMVSYQETPKNKRKKSYEISAFFTVFFSHFRLKRVDTIFLSSNRTQIEALLDNFRIEVNFKGNYLTLYQLGFQDTVNKEAVYIDLPKLFVRFIQGLFASVNLSGYMKFVLVEGYVYYLYYKVIFFFVKPKNVYFINWYDHYPALLALKSYVNTTEIQHGIIHKFHTGYRYGNVKSEFLKIPDFFAFWDENTYRFLRIPHSFKHYTFNRKPFRVKVPALYRNYLVIISQHSIRESIDEFIPIILSKYTTYERLIYRIHPKDRNYKSDIQRILNKYGNIKVEGEEDVEFESYLCPTNVFFGVFSTLFKDLIIEGYNCVVLDLPEKSRIGNLLAASNVFCLKA